MADSQDSISRIRFIENKNQWQPQVLFRADVPMGYMYLEKTGFTFDLANPEDMANVHYLKDNAIQIDLEDVIVSKHAYKIIFQNANNPDISSEGKSNDYSNYFIGNDKSKWASKVFAFNKVKYSGLYDGIDAVIYPSKYYVKYDFIIAPGANANQIQ
ncbi:MAG TPA: hypothetical protein VFM99_11520, partial [Chitinophagales bacterium]|nr:hypothetical protein [Chitinophagales bacterium]